MRKRISLVATGLLAALAGWQLTRHDFARVINAARLPAHIQSSEASSQARRSIYHAQPNHLWNRLYHHFYVRAGSDGREYDSDELDPLLWRETSYLLSGPSYQQAIKLFDEFLTAHAERLITDPLKRALLQRDLWAIFDWSASDSDQHQPQRRALQLRLAQVIQRLALNTEQIQVLPDNYALAVSSQAFAARHQPAQREQAFLPPDLFQASGSWVCLGVGYEPVAPIHIADFAFRGRSTFLTFIRLPAGREATLNYLKQLDRFPDGAPDPRNPRHWRPHPELPQFPSGTQFALARQMMLINNQGQLVPTRLTEQVQIRVYHTISSGMDQTSGEDLAAQDFYEFRLSRRKLFAGESGGLRPLGREESFFRVFSAHGIDSFERNLEHTLDRRRLPELKSCVSCHAEPGIHSVLSYARSFGPLPKLMESRSASEANLTSSWKRRQYEWGLLEGLWQPGRLRPPK